MHFDAKITKTPTQALYNDVLLYMHTGFAAIMSSTFINRTVFYAPKGLLGGIL